MQTGGCGAPARDVLAQDALALARLVLEANQEGGGEPGAREVLAILLASVVLAHEALARQEALAHEALARQEPLA